MKCVRVGEASVGLHKHQAGTVLVVTELLIYLRYVAAQNRRQVGVDDCGVASRDDFHQCADFVADRYLFEAEFSCDVRETRFVVSVSITVEENYGNGIESVGTGLLQSLTSGLFIEFHQDFSVGIDSFFDF